ncbi:transmembrane protein, putative (macronuclear) [Tetrahymena thermophila SB210]|uniref:Transmembrane protein, putative n=1 Tax=Tetrahymena thermophila (strain SB210) TaxID=312017 RepID=Q22U01_TETTS|nr:transmembrane protein, putative [Tetrahymena thermophila SB210]EAR88886.2 transmembrane protein, putative [Tetrahymena thermophila SB210]|eukprot:XP_001009131.2 transmembrane protein, putative [Tetrahymena thermophila SB210]
MKNLKLDVSDLLGDQYRRKFLNELIADLFQQYLDSLLIKKDSSKEIAAKQIQKCYIQFLAIEQLYPPKTLSLLYSIIQELNQKNKSYELFFFNILLWRVSNKLNTTLFRKSTNKSNYLSHQKPLPILLPIEFDEFFQEFKIKLSNHLLRQKEYVDYLCSGYLHLKELEEKSKKNLSYIEDLSTLQKKLIYKNPASEELQFYSSIFNTQINFFGLEAMNLQKTCLAKRREAIIQNSQNIDVFQQNSCSIYVSLAEKENQIIKVSQNFSKIFEMQVKSVIAKPLNALIPKQMSKIHSEYINQFTQKNCISSFTLTKQRVVYGINGNGFIIPLNIRIKIQNQLSEIGLCALVTRDNTSNFYSIFTNSSGKIIQLSQQIYERIFKGIYSLSELQERNIQSIMETDLENEDEKESYFNFHGVLKISKSKRNRKDSASTNKLNQDLILFTKYKCSQISIDKNDSQQYILNYEFENFWEKIENNSQGVITKRNSFHSSPLDSRDPKRKISQQLSEPNSIQILPTLSPTVSIPFFNSNQKVIQKRKTAKQMLEDLRMNSSVPQSSRMGLLPFYNSKDNTSCVFEEEDEGQEKLTSRQFSQEDIERISMEKQDSLPLSQLQKIYQQQSQPYINATTQPDTLGCISPYASKNDLSIKTDNEFYSNKIIKNREISALIACPTPTLQTHQQIFQESKQASIQESRQYSIQDSRKYSIVYQNEYCNNQIFDKKANSKNSSIHGNKEDVVIESLSSKKTEKIQNKKRLLAKTITKTKLSALPKLIGYFGILSILILISSTIYFYFHDSQNVLSSESIFNKIGKSYQIALDMFNFATEQTYSKLIKANQDVLQINKSILNQQIQISSQLSKKYIDGFISNVDQIMKSKGEDYFEYMVNTKIKVLSAIVDPITDEEEDFYRYDSVLYNLVNYIASLRQITLYPNKEVQFQMSVVYGNIVVFEESQVQIQQYILSQSESYFSSIQHDQNLQIFITSIGSLIIFLLAFPFSLYLQKKKANLLQLLGSYSPKKLEEYMNQIQISLEKIRQYEYENYIQCNPHLLNQADNNNNKGVDNFNKISLMLKMQNNNKMESTLGMDRQFQSKEKKRRTRQMASFNNFQLSIGYHIICGIFILGLLIIQPIISYTIIEKFIQDGKYILLQQQMISKNFQFFTKQVMLNIKIEDMITRTKKKDIFYLTYGEKILDQFSQYQSSVQQLINQDQQYQIQQDDFSDQIRALSHGNICQAISQNPQLMNNTYSQQDCSSLSQGLFERGFYLSLLSQIKQIREQWDQYNGTEQQIIDYYRNQQSTNQNMIQKHKTYTFMLNVFTQIQYYLSQSKQLLSQYIVSILTYLAIFQIILILVVVTFGSLYLQRQFKYGLKQTQKLLTNIPVSISLENDYIMNYFKYK